MSTASVTSTAAPHMLDGISVLDFTQVLAGPAMTRGMAEMGAEVIKVEFPGGEISRHLPFLRDGQSGYFIQQNRGKRSLCVDPKSSPGRQILRDLAARVDVLVESFTPGVIERLGLGYEAVRALNPKIVMCSISAFGQDGPLSSEPGYDNTVQAYSGVTSMVGDPEGSPALLGVAIGDTLAGANALAAVMAALWHRERTAQGQHVEVTLLDSYFAAHEISVQAVSGSRGKVQPTRTGRHHFAVCPYGLFEVKGEYIFIAAAAEHQWPQVCAAVGRPELASDPRFADHRSRLERLGEVVDLIERWLDGFDTPAQAVARLRDARIPVAPVLSVTEAMNHPHIRGRGTVKTVHDRVWGEVELPGFPLRFGAFPEPLVLEAPFLGEHNEEILEGHLGMSPERIKELEGESVLFQDPSRRERDDRRPQRG